jgi:hypothetical protein
MLTQKSEMISSLQLRLADSEKRYSKLSEDSARTAGSDQLKKELRRATADLEKAHLDLHDRVR